MNKMNTYKVKQEDLIGQLEGFPIEVVHKMVDEQVKQGNKADVSVFSNCKNAGSCIGGFTWAVTPEGNNFWGNIINGKDFSVFFKKYPRPLGKAFEDHFQNTPKEVIKGNWEKSKEKYACQVEEENNSYKYYFKGCKDGNKIVASIAEKLPQILNVGSHKCANEHHLYFVLEDFSLCHCGLGAEYLLKQLGYEEVKYEPETVEYNGKKYIKSEFEMAINHLNEVEQ